MRCTSLATGKGSCDLYEDEWACGVNVTVVYRGKMDLDVTQTLYKESFHIDLTRTPIHLQANDSAALVKVSVSTSVSSGMLKESDGDTLKGSWSGTTVTFRPNLAKNTPKVVYVYQTSSSSHTIYEDVGVLNGDGYDSSVLYNRLNSRRDTQNMSLSDLSNLNDGAGPRMLFLPGAYPDIYGTDLLNYVDGGGMVVAPYGLCAVGGSCLVGNMESITGSHTLTAVDDFGSLNPVTSNSIYFTDPDLSWIVYDSGTTNISRAAAGATSYGEGYVVFMGNESMLSGWNQLNDFLDELLLWGVKDISVTQYVCPDQSP
ncbi:hypothetical protein E2P64_00305 [Candidatus Bathyarchaeota archaeon]|nr:hypothetical protein E2P64_00305 [Candidatus Bathyarchaeota archaeon]